MKARTQAVLIDLAIHVVGTGIVALIVWIATVAAERIRVPIAAIVVAAAVSALAVVATVAYLIHARQLQRVQEELNSTKGLAAASQSALRALREDGRRIAEQLERGDQWKQRKLVVSYTVDPKGADRIESVWTLAFVKGDQGRVFMIEDSSGQPISDEVTYTCSSDSHTGSAVVPMLIVNEPTTKKVALHLYPPVGTTPRQIEVKQTWPDLWKDLRRTGADYYELTAREGLLEATVLVYIPLALGTFSWGQNLHPNVDLSTETLGVQQTLRMVVRLSEAAGQTYPVAAGQKYRVDILPKH
jgi:hypothetical protein